MPINCGDVQVETAKGCEFVVILYFAVVEVFRCRSESKVNHLL